MVRAIAIAVVAIVVALVALAWNAPAAWLGERLAAASGNTIVLASADGTVWSGRGALAGSDGRWRIPVAWRVIPSALLRGELALQLDAAEGAAAPRGTLRFSTDAIAVDGLALRLPAAALETALRGRVPVVLGGEFVIEAPAIVTGDRTHSGSIGVRWEQANIAAAGADPLALGTVTMQLDARGRAFVGPVANTGGDVRISGQVEVLDRGASVAITLTPVTSTPATVTRTLAALGPQAADGSVHLTWRGNVR